ncbi:DUF6585 family protein [Nocardia altamirensis]|uniref:DUF6585 family protein n=1 Tax=Nocardia altamirensis TaxID=472158 RepID=UPI00084058CD|nr:DUF6585 family protein [Nocardia altamirensis]
MSTPRPKRRIRFGFIATVLCGFTLAGILIAVGLPGDRESLVFNDTIVSSTDECVVINGGPGGQTRRGSCADLGHKEIRYHPAQWWAILLGLGVAGLVGSYAVRTVVNGRRAYKVEKDTVSDGTELDQVAALHQLGHRQDIFVLTRGAVISNETALLGQFGEGLVVCSTAVAPRAYRWDQIVSIRHGTTHRSSNSGYDGTDFEHALTFDDGTALAVEGSYKDPARSSDYEPNEQAAQRLDVLGGQIAWQVCTLRLPAAQTALIEGRSVDFDGIAVSTAGLVHNGTTVAWPSIKAVQVNLGVLTISQSGRLRPVVKKEVGKIPNLSMLLTLCEALRRTTA